MALLQAELRDAPRPSPRPAIVETDEGLILCADIPDEPAPSFKIEED